MIDPAGDRRPPVSPQLAWRIAVMGVLAFALFAVIFFRLWYLQVLSGDQYLAQARSNKVRIERIAAPRGDIVDRNNHVLVENRPSVVVKLRPNTLPQSERDAVLKYGADRIARSKRPKGKRGKPIPVPGTPQELRPFTRRLARTLGISARTIQERIVHGLYLTGYAPVTIKSDVSQKALTEISERSEDYPGVDVEQAYLRSYPHGRMAAQVLGSVSQISTNQLKLKKYKGIPAGTVIGQTGIEASDDNYLRGTDGTERFTVDAQGNFKGKAVARKPKPGGNVQLTLDAGLQDAAEKAFQNYAGGLAGAFVALDPRNGEVLAMGSFPNYDPEDLVKPLTQAQYDAEFGGLNGEAGPLFNRAISSDYATGSTFKLVTSMAALSTGLITPTSTVDDPGCVTYGTIGQKACNSGGGKGNGAIALPTALKVSSDVFFYKQGLALFSKPHEPLQTWARRFGFGHTTGVDLPGEAAGNVPDQAWRQRINAEERKCRKRKHIGLGADVYYAGANGCGISDLRDYSEGDNLNLAVGQGDLQATPLQLATAYSALANGNKVVVPHLTREIQDDQGVMTQRAPVKRSRHIDLADPFRQAILQGLHEAASSPGGTSADVFADWNQGRFPVYGKTGTAQVVAQGEDQSWYVCYSYDAKPTAAHPGSKPIVLAVTAERGGFGAHTAAPIAATILNHWFDQRYGVHAGSNGTR